MLLYFLFFLCFYFVYKKICIIYDALPQGAPKVLPGTNMILQHYWIKILHQHFTLRVQTNVGSVQDVAVPAPLPIRVVIHTDKQIQTDDLLENALEYSLQIRSPDPCRSSVSPMISADVGGVGSPYVNTAGVQRRVMPECAAIDADASSSSSTSTIFANSSWPWFNESSSGA